MVIDKASGDRSRADVLEPVALIGGHKNRSRPCFADIRRFSACSNTCERDSLETSVSVSLFFMEELTPRIAKPCHC